MFDLHLQGVNSPDIEGVTEEFSQLKELELLNCGIKSLDGLPHLPSLKTVIIIHVHVYTSQDLIIFFILVNVGW